MVLTLIIIDIIALYLAIRKPTIFIIYYIVLTTKCFGFLDIDAILINGHSVGLYTINVIALFTSFFVRNWYKFEKDHFKILTILLIYFLLGTSIPIMNGYSVQSTFLASKQYLYFALVFYLIEYRKQINYKIVIMTFQLIGIYFSTILIFGYYFPNIRPPIYIDDSPDLLSKMRVFFPTYISLSIFIFYLKMVNAKKYRLIILLFIFIQFIGLSLTSFFAITFCTILSITILLVSNRKIFISKVQRLFSRILMIIVPIISLLIVDSKIELRSYALIKISSLNGRISNNEFRFDVIKEKPLLGHGFVHHSSEQLKFYKIDKSNPWKIGLEIIDAGYIDLLVKFGIFGSIIFLVLISKFILNLILSRNNKYTRLVIGVFLLQYLIINITWSITTFDFGIIPFCITIYLLSLKEIKI